MPTPAPPPLPPDLPEPEDDGAADHLPGSRVPPVAVSTTHGVDLVLADSTGPAVLFCYPRIGEPLVAEWDDIPGARGCTPEACGFRDLHTRFTTAGFAVYGLSTQALHELHEAVARLELPFPLLSDAGLRLATAWRLPVFDVAGHTLLRRLTILLDDDLVQHVWYPVFPPDQHAAEVLTALEHS